MKILVLNGSPKGDVSVTMQYVHFMQKNNEEHEFKILNICQRIKAIEKNESNFNEIINEIKSADGVLWAFPVYFLLVPAGYKRFIELIWERGVQKTFQGKYCASLSTSIHFFDHIAHNYINAICDDLEMKYVGEFSPDMYDLMQEKQRKQLILFTSHFFNSIESSSPISKNYQPLTRNTFEYLPGKIPKKIETGKNRVSIIVDGMNRETNLGRMVHQLSQTFTGRTEVIDLKEIDIKGGCLGCIQCGYDNSCTYEGKDGYVEFFNTKIKNADIVIFAGSIRDRYLSARWKLFLDRSFFNNHKPVLAGKQLGFIISGPLRQLPDLKQALQGFYEVQQASIVDFITDEYDTSETIDALLHSLAHRLIRDAEENYSKPACFLGLGGKMIFRDNIFGRLRFPFIADHKSYKKNGLYNFPQKEYKGRIINALMIFMSKIPPIRKEIYGNKIKTEMIKPLQAMVEKKEKSLTK